MSTLVAGVGNLFFGDDAFGVEVARELARRPLPVGTRVADYGIRGLHLALDLLDPPELFVLVDAVSRSGRPGTLYIIDPELVDGDGPRTSGTDPHGMDPWSVLLTVQRLGGTLPRTRIVACEPGQMGEGMGLSEPVRNAIEPAIALIRRLVDAEEGKA
jgi:hydrogenase maturation protease